MRVVPKPCLHDGCPELVSSGSYCPAHRRPGQPKPSGRFSPGWKQLSLKVLTAKGDTCWICGEVGADTVDHVIPRSRFDRPADADAWDNLAPAHRCCNSRKGGKSLYSVGQRGGVR